MPYKLWHCGVLIGETDFEGARHNGRHLAGVFRPTAYGREMFPRLTGMLTAAADLKDEMVGRGLSEDIMESGEVAAFFESAPSGRKIADIGRALSEVQLRDSSGHELEVASMAFIDLAELTALLERLECEPTTTLKSLPPEAPQLIVSVTLRAATIATD